MRHSAFKTKEFRELQKKYYEKLKDEGFSDIENVERDMLNQWHSQYFQIRHRPSAYREISDYYRAANSMLSQYSFQSEIDKRIWELHTTGQAIRKISAELGQTNPYVYSVIKQVRAQFMTTEVNYSVNLIKNRVGVLDDRDFIYATWLRPFFYDNDYIGEIDRETYFEKYSKVIEFILKDSETQVTIACLKDDEEIILGYSVSKRNMLHWVYVKKAWRELGIGKSLVPRGTDTVTHLTELGRMVKPKDWKFDPFFV